jgi:hypothetical protein
MNSQHVGQLRRDRSLNVSGATFPVRAEKRDHSAVEVHFAPLESHESP